MSNAETEAPFAGKESTVTCPNCGRTLFSGLAEGNILVCRDAEGNGCQMAVDPDHVEGQTMASAPTRMEDVVPSPQVGPPNEAEDSTAPPDPDMLAAIEQPWEPPVSAPQAANVAEEAPADATTTTSTAAASSTTATTPAGAADDAKKTENGGNGTSTDTPKS